MLQVVVLTHVRSNADKAHEVIMHMINLIMSVLMQMGWSLTIMTGASAYGQ